MRRTVRGQKIHVASRAERRAAALREFLRPPRANTPSTSTHETWRCGNPYCREFTSEGAHLTGVCNHCGTPRGSVEPSATRAFTPRLYGERHRQLTSPFTFRPTPRF